MPSQTELAGEQLFFDIRKRTACDNAHRVVDVGGFHRFLQVNLLNLVKYFIVH